jgi:hypothetical protein
MVADEGLSIKLNVIGEPAIPTLADEATETDMAIGLVER